MKTMTPGQAFLGLDDCDAASYDDARAVVIPFGLEASVSYGGGTCRGPQAMIAASHELEFFDEELWCEPYREIGIVTLAEPPIAQPLPDALCQLESMVEEVVAAGKFPLVFGGEHAITAGAIRPFAKRFGDLAILHFDAHTDLRDGYDGEHYSHAAALRRCLDDDAVAKRGTHIELVSCGIRNISAEEVPFLEENRQRIHIYWARDRNQWDVDEIVAHLKGKPVYVTVDVDCFDTSLMPATGTPEPGGLFWDEVLEVISRTAHVSTIVGADINELAPIEGCHAYDFLAAKLAYKILGFAFQSSFGNAVRK
jgi:agmatinase